MQIIYKIVHLNITANLCVDSISVYLLEEPVAICAESFVHSNLSLPCIPGTVFTELILFVTMSIDFCFDNVMYKQIDG